MIKSKIFAIPLFTFFTLLFTFNARANIVFDFVELTDTKTGNITGQTANYNTFSLANPKEQAFNFFQWSKQGLTLTVDATYTGTGYYAQNYLNAYNYGTPIKSWAYLDAGNAGLGVCSLGLKSTRKGKNQCDPSNDDNVTINEILNLTFDHKALLNVNDLIFRDANHRIYNNIAPTIQYSLNQGDSWASLLPNTTLISNNFAFKTTSNQSQFYIDTLSVEQYIDTDITDPTNNVSLSHSSIAIMGFIIFFYLLLFRQRNVNTV